ncbi:hypothetical protein FMUND_2906 [Fusarium mundagurra]|uniref:Uncharacterized protein n=1 Tax=Fusarium mundagurra TaxID=1567541 RepID=A0A8H5Z188_9HYPO|nr:hypothetical protein FMUND_2906 [Fusarium mundagurra]
MVLQYAFLYIGVVMLAYISYYHNSMFLELIEEVHNMDHWNLDLETDDEDWDSEEEEDDDDDGSDDEGYSSGAVRQQTGNSDKAIDSK